MFLKSDGFDSNRSFLYLSIVFIIFVLAVLLIWYFSQAFQVSQTPQAITTTKKADKKEEVLVPETLTPEKITSSLSKSEPLEPDKSPPEQSLTEAEIKKSLQQEIPKNERPAPLSQSAIEDALNQK